MAPMLAVLVFVVVLLTAEGLFLVLRARRSDPDRVRRRLEALKERLPVADERVSILRRGKTGGPLAGLARALPLAPSLRLLLYRAGMPFGMRRFLLLSALLAVAGWAGAGLALGGALPGAPGLLAGCIPTIALRSQARRRQARFAEQLPEGLELLTRALRAGHGLGSGFQLVGGELADPIGTEFTLVAEELRFGVDLRAALQNLMHRVENPDLPYFVTAVLIQRQTGGNLAELLDRLGSLLRERSQFHGRVRALTAQGRGAALVLALWLPLITLVVYTVAPSYLAPLFENRWGHGVLATAALLDVAGYLSARRIATVEA